MNIDRYTKCVLTVIAACLMWLCFMSSGSPLGAQTRQITLPNATVQPVVIVGTGTLDQAGSVTVNFVQSGSRVTTDPRCSSSRHRISNGCACSRSVVEPSRSSRDWTSSSNVSNRSGFGGVIAEAFVAP